jgi:NitT/TauT family transport system permease protein
MTISTISRKLLKGLLIFIFWIAIWQIIAMAVDIEFLLPSPLAPAKALALNAATKKFWLSVLYSLSRVILGFASAVIVGSLLGFVTAKSSLLRSLFAPILHIVRAAPVASFIILALVWINTDILPAFISFLMGLPIIWQTVQTALDNPNKELTEAAEIFNLTKREKLLYVTIPSAFPAFLSSAVTCLGFCWKSAVAAEVICLPALAIGKGLFTAKQHLESPDVFAYTAVTVILSILIELLLKWVVKKSSERQVASHVN